MAGPTGVGEQKQAMKSKHSYTELENTQLWKVIEESLNDLIENQDIELTTRKENVIGYICNNLENNFMSFKDSPIHPASKSD